MKPQSPIPHPRSSLLLCMTLLALTSAPICANAEEDRTVWMKEAQWGVMTHYLADWMARQYTIDMNVEKWNEMVDSFDVEGLAEQIHSTGAGYLILTVGQNSGYTLSPNTTYDRLVGVQPSKCSRRDLILDMAKALQKYNIKLIAYLPSGAPGRDRAAVEALGYHPGPHRNREFQLKWEQVIREWSLRWGEHVAGWWFDGCYWPNAMYRHPDAPNFESFAAAARAGNPRSVIAFSRGVIDRVLSITPHEDYMGGEIDEIETSRLWRIEADGRVDGARVHKLSYLGQKWGAGEPRYEDLEAVVIPWTRRIIDVGGCVTWDVPIRPDGLIPELYLNQLKTIGKAVVER